MRLLGKSCGSRWVQGLAPILAPRARKARVWARERTRVGGQAGKSLPRSLERSRAKRCPRLGKALRDGRGT